MSKIKEEQMVKERRNKQTDFRVIIRKLIIQKQISICRLARHPNIDLHHNTLYNYLNENSEMSGKNIEKVIDTLKAL
jgi:hypothetical protein